METTALLAWLTLVVAVPLQVLTTSILWRSSKRAPKLRVLRERFRVSLVTTFVVLFFGLIFVNNDRPEPPLDVDTTKLITRSAILAMSLVSSVGWILLYRALTRSDPES